jgi:hypothetical protein
MTVGKTCEIFEVSVLNACGKFHRCCHRARSDCGLLDAFDEYLDESQLFCILR